jgi:cell division protein FtsL
VTVERRQQQPPVFRREIRDAIRYERGLVAKALVVLAVVAVIIIARTLYFA